MEQVNNPVPDVRIAFQAYLDTLSFSERSTHLLYLLKREINKEINRESNATLQSIHTLLDQIKRIMNSAEGSQTENECAGCSYFTLSCISCGKIYKYEQSMMCPTHFKSNPRTSRSKCNACLNLK